jgi:flagellar basal-body rod modification protein FlgD
MAIVDTGAVYNTYGTSSTTTSSTTSSNKTLDKDAFMKMFLAQLQNQDPLNPMDSTQLAAQMAQFTSVEQLSNLNTTMTQLLKQEQATLNATLINLLGREAVVQGNTIYVGDNKVTQGSFQLDLEAFCQVGIYDSEGTLVKTINLGQRAANESVAIEWDGTDDSGNKVADGTYTFKVTAERADGQTVTPTTFAGGLITGIKNDNEGNAQIVLNNATTVAISNVMEVRTPKDAESE